MRGSLRFLVELLATVETIAQLHREIVELVGSLYRPRFSLRVGGTTIAVSDCERDPDLRLRQLV